MFKRKQMLSSTKVDFKILVDQEKDQLYRMAYMYTRNEEDALELLQETLLKAYKNFHTLRQKEFFSTWIIRIMMNLYFDQLKKQKKYRSLSLDTLPESHLPYYESESSIEERLDLFAALEQLNQHSKTVLFLRYYKDLSIKDIAMILECPDGTVKTHIHRALKQLKQVITKGVS